MKSLLSKVLIPTVLLIQSCGHSKNLQSDYFRVPLDHVLDSIGSYQHKKVAIRGYYVCGAEHASLQPEFQPVRDNKSYDWTSRIWVEARRSKPGSDTLGNRTVWIRGTIDSSRHGREGGYPATIRHAVIDVQ